MADAGSLLIRAGLIRPEALDAARRARNESGGTLAEHLVLSGAVSDETLTQFYRERLLVPRVSNSKLAALPDHVITQIPGDMAAELRVVPVALDRDGNMTVAMSDPSDTHAVDELGFFTDHYVVRAVASQRQIAWGLAHYYNIMTPMAKVMLAEEKAEAAAASNATEPYLKASDAVETKKRPRSLSIQVAAARHRVIAPQTRPPLDASRPSDATREELESAVARARVAGSPARAATIRDPSEMAASDDEDAPFMESLPDYLRSALEGPPPDEASISGVIDAVQPAVDDASESASTVEVSDQAIELDADWAEDDEEEMAPLEDGSPPELAPRAGELLVNRSKAPSVGASTPAVVLDDELITVQLAPAPQAAVVDHDDDDLEPEIEAEIEADYPGEDGAVEPDLEIEPGAVSDGVESESTEPYSAIATVPAESDAATGPTIELEAEPLLDDNDFDDDDYYDYEEDGEDELDAADLEEIDELPADEVQLLEEEMFSSVGAPLKTRGQERGTDSAPFLLSELSVHRRDAKDTDIMPELVTLPVDEEESGGDDVVLLDSPKRNKRSTALGIGLPEAEVAAIMDLEGEPEAETGAGTEVGPALPEPITTPTPVLRPRTATPDVDDDSATRLLDSLEGLQMATDRDAVVTTVLDYLESECRQVAFFALRHDVLELWQVRAENPPDDPVSLTLEGDSTLKEIVDTRLPYAGPISDARSRTLLAAVFGSVGADSLVVPVAVRDRVVGLIYADSAFDSLRPENVALLSRAAGRALERVLRRKPTSGE